MTFMYNLFIKTTLQEMDGSLYPSGKLCRFNSLFKSQF